MANYDVVFDIGSQYVSAALKEDGYFVKIPSAVACEGADGKQAAAVGVEALNLAKTSAGKIKLVYPILEGSVIDADCAKALFAALLDRILPNKAKIFSQLRVTCVVPCGIISGDKKTVENIFLMLGARQVNFVETPLADSAALFKEFRTTRGVIADIGYDCTDLAVVYAENIVTGCTLYHSGKHLTQAVAERVRSKYMIQLSDEQAEKLKLSCASLYSNDISTCTVTGQNVQTGNTESVNISSKELYDTVVEFVKKYRKVIESLLTSVPDQLSALVRSEGVLLCGGGAQLLGLDAFLHGELNLPVRTAADPANTSISGALEL